MKTYLLAATLCACAALLLPSVAAATDFTPGAPGAGDPMYPLAGNGGYDVAHYALKLAFEPDGNHLAGRVTVRATATQDLSRFDLDLRAFTVRRVLVDGVESTFTRDGQELIITPVAGIPDGKVFEVVVRYAGVPEVVVEPNGDVEGWVPTNDGACVVGEPQGAPGWYPVDDDPEDKATYDFAVTVPKGLTVMANGVLLSHKTADGKTTWRWRETDPMSSYLATATIGRFDLSEYAIDGIPTYVAVDPQCPKGKVLDKLPGIVRFFVDLYGEYPFNAAGAIVDNAKSVGYALETQTKPVFDHMPDEWTLVHETAHMWYGDSVTLKDWPDIWLNEGFATFSNWIWSERQGNQSAHQQFKANYSTGAQSTWLWGEAPGAPAGPGDLFDWGPIYVRGAMTLQALREKIGDEAFFTVMREWAAQNRHGSVTTQQFITLAEQVSGMDLYAFFQAWVYEPGKPTAW
jgi:aminopeptidase N